MLKYLLDTHIAIYVIKRRPIEVMGVFNQNAGRMAISSITLSKLCHGAEKSAKVAQNLAVVEEFASLLEVLPYCAKVSAHYGAIRAVLERMGRPMDSGKIRAAHKQCPRETSTWKRLTALRQEPTSGRILQSSLSASMTGELARPPFCQRSGAYLSPTFSRNGWVS